MVHGYIALLIVRDKYSCDSFLFWHVFRRPLTNLPPEPWPLSLLENLLQLDDLPHHSFVELEHQHGPLMFLCLGLIPYIIVSSSPPPATQILRKHNQVLSYRVSPDALRALDHDKPSMLLPAKPA
ncbi:ferruginol synthase-like [Wolffia australiana]